MPPLLVFSPSPHPTGCQHTLPLSSALSFPPSLPPLHEWFAFRVCLTDSPYRCKPSPHASPRPSLLCPLQPPGTPHLSHITFTREMFFIFGQRQCGTSAPGHYIGLDSAFVSPAVTSRRLLLLHMPLHPVSAPGVRLAIVLSYASLPFPTVWCPPPPVSVTRLHTRSRPQRLPTLQSAVSPLGRSRRRPARFPASCTLDGTAVCHPHPHLFPRTPPPTCPIHSQQPPCSTLLLATFVAFNASWLPLVRCPFGVSHFFFV